MLYEFIAVLTTLALGILAYFKWCFKYWERKGVPYEEPSIPFGNGQNPFSQKLANYEVLRRSYARFKSLGHRHGGIYVTTTPVYTPTDLELVKHILAKDFAHFTDRGVYVDEKNDPHSAHLFSLEGQKWRTMRTKLTPTFTSGKMKIMFQTLLDCGEQLKEHVAGLDASGLPLDVKDVLASFTTDVIGSCAFGLDCNSFKDPDSEFRRHGRVIFKSNFRRRCRLFCIVLLPKLSRWLGLPIFERDLTGFYMDVVRKVVEYREANDVRRNDFMQILMELRQCGADGRADGLSLEEVAAQAFVFFLAGFETSSTAMTFCLFELARNADVQEKLRREVDAAFEKNAGKLTYDGIMELKYMGQVVDETLRKYPPVPTLLRKCVKEYGVPDTDVTLDERTRVFISVMGIHHDPEHYPDPERFDPDRFSDEGRAGRHPYAFLPFGEGPRICIGLRFGLMQTRVGLALILKHYRLKVSAKTELPLQMDPNAFLLNTKKKIWLETEKI